MQTRDRFTYYFFNLEPFDCHPVDDRRAMLLRAAKLHVVSGVPQADIMGAFNLSAPPSHAPSNATESAAKTPSSSPAGGAGVPSSTPRWPTRRPNCSLAG